MRVEWSASVRVSVTIGSLCLATLAQAQQASDVRQTTTDVRQMIVLKQIDADDLNITGFLASRDATQFPDYRVYLGVDYGADLGNLAKLTSRAFYGTGTYDGFDPKGPALPEEVRSSGIGPGQWVGADWSVESRVFSRHALSTRVEYRQELSLGGLDIGSLMGRPAVTVGSLPERRVGFITNDNVSLADNLSLNVRVRYDEAASSATSATPSAAIAPRVELAYKPAQNSMLNAVFYRYSADGLMAYAPVPGGALAGANAQIDTSGFEVGLERNVFGGARTRLSYAWQSTTDWLAGSANGSLAQSLAKASMEVPILPKRLSTSFELQYIGLNGPLIGAGDRQHVIGNFTVASGTVSRDTRITFGMRNLFGAKPAGTSGPVTSFVPPDGRSVRLDVERKL